MASANSNEHYRATAYNYDPPPQSSTFSHSPANGSQDLRQTGYPGHTNSSFRNFAPPTSYNTSRANFQQRSTSISSTATSSSRNFSRPVLMHVANNSENSSSLPHIVDQDKRNSFTKKLVQPVQPVDSAVASPAHVPEHLQYWQANPSYVIETPGPVLDQDQTGSFAHHPAHHPPYHHPHDRKSSGALGGMTVPYNPSSQHSNPPDSQIGMSSASHSRDFGSPISELPEIEALSIQPRQQFLPQHAQIHSNPHAIKPEVAVYHVDNRQQQQQQQQPNYNYGETSEFMGEPGPMIEEALEQFPHPGFHDQYEQYAPNQHQQYAPNQHQQYVSNLHQPYAPNLTPEGHMSAESISRPRSTNTLGSSSNSGSIRQASSNHKSHLSAGGTPSPINSPMLRAQNQQGRYSPENRSHSYIDLLQTPYAQQVAPSPNLDNSFLRQVVGKNASLLEASKTLDAYRANVKNISDPAIQYEFAVFMVQTALELPPESQGPPSRADLIKDARGILQKLVDKSYPFAQYYLADGYASGLFNKGKEDYDRAFPLFVAAAKRGHAEAGYRAGLCYELGWGCRKDYSKAVRFYEMSASKNHPGSATRLGLAFLNDLLGQHGKYREGYKWLKRAAESADAQYNAAPYELAKLHENGFGADIFKDEAYAAQLFTQSANLGHSDANLVMGKAYEHGYLGCPQDALLSIHYYTGAANAGEPEGMMALCAWYLFGAPPLLEKNDNEAFEWAKQAAACGYAKAEYATGYFKEMGIGCRQDTMEANHWYWRAAQQGDERAKQRMKTIENAVSGGSAKKDDEHKTKKSLFGRLVK